jgi:hypothetical protein
LPELSFNEVQAAIGAMLTMRQGDPGRPVGKLNCFAAFALAAVLLTAVSANAQEATPSNAAQAAGSDSAEELAKKLQNPIGDLYTIPFQSNTNFNVGPHKGTQEILNIQPVIPIHLNEDWNIITRTILPVIWNPSLLPAPSVSQGTGPTTFSAFLSPSKPNDGWLWGVGPVVQIPTISSPTLGSNVWGVGPALVVVKMAGPIVAGALVNNVFSLGGTSGPTGTRYATFTFNPFLNYNFKGGWFVGSAPIVTANEYGSGQRWTVPVGLQGGRLIKLFNKLPVNLLAGAYYNVVRPQGAGDWQFRTQVAIIF